MMNPPLTTTRAVRAVSGGVIALALVCVGTVAHAQVRPPNIKAPINAAKNAANKTSEQIKAAEKAGGAGAVGDGTMQAKAAQGGDAQKAAPPGGAQRKSAAPAGDSGSASQSGRGRPVVTIMREAFSYNAGGRRDPFVSLMLSGELRPIITDLTLTGVIFDRDPRQSIALLVDISTGESYRVRVGQTLGRMKVAKIGLEDITFDVDEFGLSRSETLIIDKSATPAGRRP